MRFMLGLIGAAVSMLAGCAGFKSPAESPHVRLADAPEATPQSEPPKPAAPFAIREAALPEGFPPPGPVDVIVIKEYPAYRSAVKRATGGQGPNQMFRPLFNHIKKNDIAMTAPVEMTYEGGGAAKPTAMAFLYGTPQTGRIGADGDVEVMDVPAMTVVSIGVRGDYSADAFSAAHEKLNAWLADHAADYTVAGPPRYMGYNSPFVPWFLRYGEVQIPIAALR